MLNKSLKKNCRKKENGSLQNFRKRDDIIITKAIKEVPSFLWTLMIIYKKSIGKFYKKLTIDTTEINCIKVNRTISKLKSLHLLNEKIANVLLRSEAKIQKHKMLPKVHKESNPGTPVVSLIDCYTTKTSKHIDHQLQPHEKELKSYVKDSTDFIRKINSMEKNS